ncbi:hypothetical protein Tcan_07508 [Toxocara canis]|uniref:Uncharacterized protein n=1 Tax=Toxocara canis TaxID=6265 RepID=A0A0B2V8F9_TOXCA|nr:hypothetical protein Tcan_07508 [Toxocara canis]
MPHPLVDLDLPSGVLNVCYEESQCGEIIHSTKESGTAAVVDGSSDSLREPRYCELLRIAFRNQLSSNVSARTEWHLQCSESWMVPFDIIMENCRVSNDAGMSLREPRYCELLRIAFRNQLSSNVSARTEWHLQCSGSWMVPFDIIMENCRVSSDAGMVIKKWGKRSHMVTLHALIKMAKHETSHQGKAKLIRTITRNWFVVLLEADLYS